MSSNAANDEQTRYWNGDEAVHWLDHEARYEVMLAPFTGHLLAAAGVSTSDRVLDLGCGCGSTTRAAGRRTRDGEALGVDLSRPLLERAEQRTQEEALTNVRFERADVQVHRFSEESFDVAISRFGAMFFDEPITGFTNIRHALRPGGRLVFACWAGPLENEWIVVPGAAAAEHVSLPPVGDPESPGPFSLADRDRIAALVDAAGMVDIDILPVAEPMLLGADVDDTVDFLTSTGFGQRMLAQADAATVDRVADAWRSALTPYMTSDGIRLGSKAWLVTARCARADSEKKQ